MDTLDFKRQEDVAVKRNMLLLIIVLSILLVVLMFFLNSLVNEKKALAKEEIFLTINDLSAPQIELCIEAEEEIELLEEQEYEYYYEPTYSYSYTGWYESDDEEAELSAKEWIAWRESGGDYDARNGQYIGRYQLSQDKLDGDYSPEHQEEVAEAYVQDRYGSWEAAKDFWEANGWY